MLCRPATALAAGSSEGACGRARTRRSRLAATRLARPGAIRALDPETTPKSGDRGVHPRVDVPVASRREALAGSLVAATARVRASLLTAVSVAAGALARPPDAAATRPLAVVRAPPVAADAPAEILLSVVLPPGYHLTKGANSRFEVDVDEDARVVVEPLAGKLAENADVKLTVRPANGAANGAGEGSANAGEVRANCTVYFCRADDICLVQRVRFEAPAAAGGADRATLRFDVPAAEPPVAPSTPAVVPSFDDL